jgi:hypothetical protein
MHAVTLHGTFRSPSHASRSLCYMGGHGVMQITWQPRRLPSSTLRRIVSSSVDLYCPLNKTSSWPEHLAFLITIQCIARKRPRVCARQQASPYYYQDAKSPLLRFQAPVRLSKSVPIALQKNFWRLFDCAAGCKNAALSFLQEMSSVAAPACCTSCSFVFMAGSSISRHYNPNLRPKTLRKPAQWQIDIRTTNCNLEHLDFTVRQFGRCNTPLPGHSTLCIPARSPATCLGAPRTGVRC